MCAPIDTTYYEAQVYTVDEIDISGDEAGDWEYKEDYWGHEGEIFLKDYHGQKNHIILPATINGKRVSQIDSFAFQKCGAETIEIPGSYGKIAGNMRFQNQHLKTLIIGEGIKEIGDGAFFNVPSLENVYASQSIEMVYGDHAFQSTKWYDRVGDYAIIGRVLMHYKGDGHQCPSWNKDSWKICCCICKQRKKSSFAEYCYYFMRKCLLWQRK